MIEIEATLAAGDEWVAAGCPGARPHEDVMAEVRGGDREDPVVPQQAALALQQLRAAPLLSRPSLLAFAVTGLSKVYPARCHIDPVITGPVGHRAG